MNPIDDGAEKEGGYVFISHSHKDIKEVRKLRNILEEQGFEPLFFYLKCLSDDDEVEGLIKREIDAREWFVYVDSPNARMSSWVQKERDYINSLGNKRVLSISLGEDISTETQAKRIMRSLRVFLSYSHLDSAIVEQLQAKFLKRDLQVWWDRDFMAKEDWGGQTTKEMGRASEDGCMVLLLTKNSVHSEKAMNELTYFMEKKALVLPIVVGNVDFTPAMRCYLDQLQFLQLSDPPKDRELEHVVQKVENLLIDRFNRER